MTERLKVYVSGPISNGGRATADERMANVRVAVDVFLELVDAGFCPVLPQLTEFIEVLSGRRLPHSEWMEIDLPWVRAADAVFRMPGDSSGSDIECAEARRVGIPVFYAIDDMREWAHIQEIMAEEEELATK